MKRLLLVGAAQAHLQVLAAFARDGLPAGAEALLVAPHAQRVHPGLLAAWLAGRADDAACTQPLAPLTAAAHVHFVEGTPVALDAAARRLTLADGRVAEYELLSIDDPGQPDRDTIPGAREHALFVRPLEAFVALAPRLLALAASRPLDLVVIGAGTEALETALALQHRLGADTRVALVTGGALLPGWTPAARQRAARALARRRVTVLPVACVRIEAGCVVLANGARLACDAPLVAGGLQAPGWLAGSGLALDVNGQLATAPTRQCLARPEVFAGGEGVDGEALASNLRRCIGGGELAPLAAPRAGPVFVDCGDGRAIAAGARWSAEGRWVMAWKQRRERREGRALPLLRPSA